MTSNGSSPQARACRARRNEYMVRMGAGLCLTVHRSIASSRGTKGYARLVIGFDIPTWPIDSDEARPVRLVAGDARLDP